jgi:hypothetical protein
MKKIIWPASVDEADVGRIEAPGGERGHRHRAVAPVGHAVHRVLVEARVLLGLEPHPGHALAREPLVVLGIEPDDGAALGADEVGHRDPDRPAELPRLGDDLVGGVLALRPADLGMASISSTVSKSFIPMGIVRRRRYW